VTRVAVVGSGPAGTFCAKALIARGLKVTMLDAGETLDAHRQGIVDTLAAQPLENWDSGMIAEISRNPTVHRQAIPSKLVFGSNYVYGRDRSHSALDVPPNAAIPTFALGGYSVVWGASVLPWQEKDLIGWPVRLAALDPYYRKIFEHLPLAGADDALGEQFPSLKSAMADLAPSPQGSSLLRDLAKAQGRLKDEGVLAGRARLAVHNHPGSHGDGCIHCGQCLTGCPTGAIYGTGHDIAAMVRAGSLEYRGGLVVRSMAEDADGVEVELINSATTKTSKERFNQVFVGAGPISTTRIMMQSLGMFDETLTLRDSQKFLVPMLRHQPTPRAAEANANMLAAAFLEIDDPNVSPHWIHVQVSPASRLMAAKFGPFSRMARPLLNRLMVCWGGIHSAHSGALNLRLTGAGGDNVLVVTTSPNPEAKLTLRRLGKKLNDVAKHFAAYVPAPLMRQSSIGFTSQIGGSFPMQKTPKDQRSSDTLGRPCGMQRVYLIDSSTFPSVPATTMALSVMANAYRIGTETPLDR
jgi:choline dehydrogenase-like flavoprotein